MTMIDIMCVNEVSHGRFEFRTAFGDIVLAVDGKVTQAQMDLLSNVLTNVGMRPGRRFPQHDCIRSMRAKARMGYPDDANANRLAALEAQELAQLWVRRNVLPELAADGGPTEEDGPWAKGWAQRHGPAPLVDVVITPEQATAHRERKPAKVTVFHPDPPAAP